jgi:GNAT superfamily N-acetyltransferase
MKKNLSEHNPSRHNSSKLNPSEHNPSEHDSDKHNPSGHALSGHNFSGHNLTDHDQERVSRLGRDELSGEVYRGLVESLFGAGQVDQRLRYIRWLFEQNPALKPAEALPIYVHWIGSQPTGQLGIIPVELVFSGKPMRGGWCVEFYILPGYRRRGIGGKLLHAAHQDFPLLLTLGQTDSSFSLFRKRGWHHLAPPTIHKKLLRYGHSLPKWALQKVGFSKAARCCFPQLRARSFRAPKDILCDQIDTFMDIPSLPQRHGPGKPGASYIRRSAAFLEWRFFSNPFVKYHVRRIGVNGQHEVYVAWRLVRYPIWYRAVLVDVLYPAEVSTTALEMVLKLAMRWAASQGAEQFECQTSDPRVLNALPTGFLTTRQPGARFLYGMLDMTQCPIVPSDEWRLFAADCDVEGLSTLREAL